MPWSRFWDRNYFALLVPALHAVITNNYVRGAVSGLGLVNLWLALAELATVVSRRNDTHAPAPEGPG